MKFSNSKHLGIIFSFTYVSLPRHNTVNGVYLISTDFVEQELPLLYFTALPHFSPGGGGTKLGFTERGGETS